jgi:hypothetical protein
MPQRGRGRAGFSGRGGGRGRVLERPTSPINTARVRVLELPQTPPTHDSPRPASTVSARPVLKARKNKRKKKKPSAPLDAFGTPPVPLPMSPRLPGRRRTRDGPSKEVLATTGPPPAAPPVEDTPVPRTETSAASVRTTDSRKSVDPPGSDRTDRTSGSRPLPSIGREDSTPPPPISVTVLPGDASTSGGSRFFPLDYDREVTDAPATQVSSDSVGSRPSSTPSTRRDAPGSHRLPPSRPRADDAGGSALRAAASSTPASNDRQVPADRNIY